MASEFSPNLRIELIGNGEQAGTWGTTTNRNLGTLIESAISGWTQVTISSTSQALTALDGAADQARNAMVQLNSASASFSVFAPPYSKQYMVFNNTSYPATLYNSTSLGDTTAAGSGVVIPSGKTMLVWSNGTSFYSASNHSTAFDVGGILTTGASVSIGGSQETSGSISATGSILTSGSAFLNGATAQTVAQASAVSTANDTITLASAVYGNGMAVAATSSGVLPTGLSTNTTYFVVGTSATAQFSGLGSISGTTLTISAVYAGSIGIGTAISGGSATPTTVSALGTGTGGIGTYTLADSQIVASTTIRGTYSGTQTIKLSTSIGGSAVNISDVGSGNLTLTPVSLGVTAPKNTSTNALATCAFVAGLGTENWGVDETSATQTATITIASPAVVTVASAPANGTAVAFTTSGALPTGITENTAYYVYNRTSTTYSLGTTVSQSETVTLTIANPGVVTVPVSTVIPADGQVVVFSTTGALPTGLVAGTPYFVVGGSSSTFTFQVSATSGGSAIEFSGSQSGTQTATWCSAVTTSGSQSGTHTENTSNLNFKYKTITKMSVDLGGNLVLSGNVTAFGTP